MQGITKTIAGVIDMTWPMVIVSIVIIVSVRICYLVKNNEHFSLYKELLMLSMIIYVLMLFQVVTSQDVVNWSSNNFIPFKEMLRYRFGSRLFIKNVMGNVLLFIPFGFFTSYILKRKRIYIPIILTIITSITIETTQLYIGRVFDIDDIILNVVGGIIGYLLYIFLDEIKIHLPKYLKKDWFINTILILIIMLIFIWLTNMFNIKIIGG